MVEGDINIVASHALRALPPFAKLTNITGTLLIIENNMLTDISGFGALTNALNIEINDNPALTTVSGFGSLNTLGGGLGGHLVIA